MHDRFDRSSDQVSESPPFDFTASSSNNTSTSKFARVAQTHRTAISAKMRSAHDRTRSRRGSQESRPSPSSRSSLTEETATSPALSLAEGFEAYYKARRSSSNSKPATPLVPGTPSFRRSSSTFRSDEDGEALLPTVSKLGSPEKASKWLRSSPNLFKRKSLYLFL